MIVVETASNALLEQALKLRRAVFVVEQDVPGSAEFDWLDETAEHLVAVEAASWSVPAGLSFDREQMVLQRVAVDSAQRGAESIDARRRGRTARAAAGVQRIDMHAQLHAVGIYESAGFVAHGKPFDEDGIQHIAMTLELT